MESNLMSKGEILEKIQKVQKQLSEKQFSKSLQIGIFFLVVCIMLFFLVFFISDFLNIIGIYFQKVKNIKAKEKMFVQSDDNDYDKSGIQYENEIDHIEDQIVKRNLNLENRLKEMVEWKKSNKIPNVKIESKIDMTVMEDKFDNYKYDKQKNGESFWKLLIMPPKYYQYINNKAKPFYRFMNQS